MSELKRARCFLNQRKARTKMHKILKNKIILPTKIAFSSRRDNRMKVKICSNYVFSPDHMAYARQ